MPDSVAELEYRIFLEFKPDDMLVRNKLGMVYFRLNRFDDAEKEFAGILKRQPENYDALDGMGLVKASRGEYEQAVGLHRRALAINERDMTIYYHLGVALEKTDNLKDALQSFRSALKIFQEQPRLPESKEKGVEFEKKVRAAISRLEPKR